MRFDDIDEYTVMLADAYAKDEYRKGYEAGYKAGLKKGRRIGSKACFNHLRKVGELRSHGYWIDWNFDCNGQKMYRCSCCDISVFGKGVSDLPCSCPYCNAKMYNQNGGHNNETD